MPETPTFGRYAEIPYDEMTPEQQEGYRFLVEVRGAAGGPSKIWVHNPKLVKASAPLGAHFHPGGYSLSEREREIAVIIINSKWHSAYPTAAHERRGKEVGLPADKIEALIAGQTDPAGLAELAHRRLRASPETLREALRGRVTRHHRFLLALHLKQIDALDEAIAGIDAEVDTQIEPCRAALTQLKTIPGIGDLGACVILAEIGHVGITDVITLMGYYTSVSMTLAFYDVPAGAPGIAR